MRQEERWNVLAWDRICPLSTLKHHLSCLKIRHVLACLGAQFIIGNIHAMLSKLHRKNHQGKEPRSAMKDRLGQQVNHAHMRGFAGSFHD